MNTATKIGPASKVLVIEDNPGDARLVEIYLAESDLHNCQIVHKTTLGAGLETLETGVEFAAVLLDLTLPDSRGFETLEKLASRFPQNNIIVLTGLADKELGLRAVKAGAQDFLVKGAFDSDLLAKSLRFSIERNKVLKRLEETQRLANIGHWEYHPGSGLFNASEELYHIFGCPPEMRFTTWNETLSSQSPFSLLAQAQAIAAKGGTYREDLKVSLASGGFCYIYIQCRSSYREDGSFFFQGIVQDITERKLTEQEMIKSRERYQEVFTKSKDALFICTLEGRILDFNHATTQLLGYSPEELLALPQLLQLCRQESRQQELLAQLRQNGAVQDFELQILNKQGEVRDCLVTASTLNSEDLEGYSIMLRDVTAHRQAEEFRKARDLAQQKEQMKEQFLASISHEMRTPMNAILGMSNILLQSGLVPSQTQLVESIKSSSAILLGVVNDILEISEFQNGKLVFQHEPFDLDYLLRELVNVMQYKAQEKDIYLQADKAPDVPGLLKGDKLRLNQILYNLVGNAIKFTDKGKVQIFVEKISQGEGGVRLKFSVEDTGIGIEKADLGAIFDTFTRVRHRDRLYEGTGLGLSICRHLVEMQQGKIEATSTPGRGSVFFFELFFEQAEALTQPDSLLDEIEETLPSDASFRLLLVEDHKLNQLVATKILLRRWENLQLATAENGREAIELLQRRDFDIVLMDIQMPVMDGYETTRFIREQMPPEKSGIPILAMTAHAHISKEDRFSACRMDNFILKPFEPEELYYKVAKHVSKRQGFPTTQR
jgi:PAS domain S-box-containing protein